LPACPLAAEVANHHIQFLPPAEDGLGCSGAGESCSSSGGRSSIQALVAMSLLKARAAFLPAARLVHRQLTSLTGSTNTQLHVTLVALACLNTLWFMLPAYSWDWSRQPYWIRGKAEYFRKAANWLQHNERSLKLPMRLELCFKQSLASPCSWIYLFALSGTACSDVHKKCMMFGAVDHSTL